jgi:hypothetical protein
MAYKKIPRQLKLRYMPSYLSEGVYLQYGPLIHHTISNNIYVVYLPNNHFYADGRIGFAAYRLLVNLSSDSLNYKGRLCTHKEETGTKYYTLSPGFNEYWVFYPELRPFLIDKANSINGAWVELHQSNIDMIGFKTLVEYMRDIRSEQAKRNAHPYKMISLQTTFFNNPSIYEP